MITPPTSAAQVLVAPYRAVRPLRARTDAPWPAMLVETDSAALRLLVDVAYLPEEWIGWNTDADGHVLGPLDVARRQGGQDVVLPLCRERVDDFLRRRVEAGIPLSPSECVTLAVSVLRGMAEMSGRDVEGEWWLTDEGRPLLATQTGDVSAHDSCRTVLRALDDHAPDARWRRVVEAVESAAPRQQDILEAEAIAFAVATPAPLATGPLIGGARSRGIESEEAIPAARQDVVLHSPTLVERLARHVDADLADTFSRATTAVWRRATKGERRKHAPALVAAAVAATILGAGLLWPAGEPEHATADGSQMADHPDEGREVETVAGADSPPESGGGGPIDTARGSGEDDTPVARAERLIGAVTACAGDSACHDALSARPGLDFTGAVMLPAAERTLAVVDDFGGVAVVSVIADDSVPPQMVVIEKVDEKWLLRDVYDVAQQP